AAVAGAVAWAPKGKPDVDVYRIDIPGPDGGVDAAVGPPGPAGGDAAPPPAPAPRPKLMTRIEATPEVGVALKLDVLDAARKTVVSAGGADPGQAVTIPNLALGAAAPFIRVRRAAAGERHGP